MTQKIGLIGVDIGTESLRAALFDLQGTILATAQYPYTTLSPLPGRFEQNPADWWAGLKATVSQCLKQARLPPESVVGLGFTGTSCTVVPVDKQGNPLRPAIMWMDTRAFLEAQEITALHHPAIMQASGHVSPEWMLPKALWIKRHEPEVWQRTHKLAEGFDYLIWKLSGHWTAATGSAVGKRHWLRSRGGWATDLYKSIGLPEFVERNADEVFFPGDPAAELTKEGAQELGLRPGTVLTNCGPDGYIAMVGINAISPKQLALIIGSSTCHLLPTEKAVHISGMWGPWCDILLRDEWLIEGGQLATGSILRWFATQFATGLREEARRKGISIYRFLDEQAANIPAGSAGLVVLDYWKGNRTPYNDAQATGAIWGLTLDHTLAHVYRAILEGTAYGAAHTVMQFRRAGLRPQVIVACGGGARSKLWLQIHANACDLPVQPTNNFEYATAFGAAISAAVAAGYHNNLAEAAAQMVKVTQTIEVHPETAQLYSEYLQQYIGTYEALHERMRAISRLRSAE